MIFSSQFEAKRFFVDKVITQAQKDNTPLSEAEKYMLNWTEVEEGFKIDESINQKFYQETTDDDYEKKVCSPLKRAYESDVSADPAMKETYRSAYRAIEKNDHYILIMIRDALGTKLKRWGLF